MGKQWMDIFSRQRDGYPLSQSLPNLLTSNAALEAYRQHLAPEYIVMGLYSWWGHEGTFVTNVRPEPYPGSPSDYAVFPPNLAWTMAFTHHDFGYGELGPPHFARHPDYVRLNEENRTALDALCRADAEASRAKKSVADPQPERLISVTGVKLGPLPERCPNCEKLISRDAENCLHCGVTFGPASNWKVRPL